MSQDRHRHLIENLTRHHDRLLAYIVSLLGSRVDAEDVLQRTNILIWQKFDEFDLESDFLAWATSIAFYEVRNFQRVSGRDRHRFSESLLETLAEERLRDLTHLEERLEALDRCLEHVEGEDRELLKTAYRGDRTIRELAAEVGRAPQTLYNRLASLRRQLADCIEGRPGGSPAS